MFHNHVTIQANAYRNGCWVIASAKAGREDGFGLIGGSCIIAPTGEIAAVAMTEDDELVTCEVDFSLGEYIRRTVFNFEKRFLVRPLLSVVSTGHSSTTGSSPSRPARS